MTAIEQPIIIDGQSFMPEGGDILSPLIFRYQHGFCLTCGDNRLWAGTFFCLDHLRICQKCHDILEDSYNLEELFSRNHDDLPEDRKNLCKKCWARF